MYMMANKARKLIRKAASAGVAKSIRQLQSKRITASMSKTVRELKQFVKTATAFPVRARKRPWH